MFSKGYAHDFLSRISFNNEDIDPSYAVPFSCDLTVQHDSRILCLPYNISPLSLPIRLQYLPKRVAVADNLEFDPAIKINFVSNIALFTYGDALRSHANSWQRTRY
jgi:hypothetical protein